MAVNFHEFETPTATGISSCPCKKRVRIPMFFQVERDVMSCQVTRKHPGNPGGWSHTVMYLLVLFWINATPPQQVVFFLRNTTPCALNQTGPSWALKTCWGLDRAGFTHRLCLFVCLFAHRKFRCFQEIKMWICFLYLRFSCHFFFVCYNTPPVETKSKFAPENCIRFVPKRKGRHFQQSIFRGEPC